MRAWTIRHHGDADALELEERAAPNPGPGEVVVDVRAVGINFLDIWVRRGIPGAHFPLPLIPGSDISGVISAVGRGVDDIAEGAEVIVAPARSCGRCPACHQGRDHQCREYRILGEHCDGGYTEQIAVPRTNILPKPANIDFAEAAALGIPFLTAWHMLVARAELRPGETVLVQAAGSGVGSAAVQIAKLWGARVIATAGSDAKLSRARALGADLTVSYATEDVASRVRELTDGRGVDVVFEHVGAATWEGSLRSLAWHGRLVTCGATSGAAAQINLRHLFFKQLSILGSTMGSKGELWEILSLVQAGRLRPVVDRALPLAEARRAHTLIEQRELFGKVVLLT